MTSESLVGNWNYPTAVRFGAGRISELPEVCGELGMTKPLLITDPGLAALPLVDDTVAINEKAGLPTAVFSDVQPNPIGKNVEEGVAAYKAGGHDGVIAFGGGSALDAAKAVALLVGQSRPLWDFEDVGDWYTRVEEEGMAPVVAVPTTSGTGSEVGRSSVIVDEDLHKKKIIFHPKMVPARVICDPELTVGLPPKLTGAVGMDALSHNLEAYLALGFHPQADGIAIEGMRLVRRSLVTAFRTGEDINARAQMLAASLMGATAFQKGLGAMHSVSHTIGGRFDVHHGTAIAVMMPYVLRLNRPAVEERMTLLASYLGLEGEGFTAVLDWVLELRRELEIPHTLAEVGITDSDVDELAEAAALRPTARSNPVPLNPDNLRGLIKKAMVGDTD